MAGVYFWFAKNYYGNFLGIVISTPLEMKIFEDRIDSQLVKDNIMRTNATRQEVTKGNTSLIQRRDKLESEHKAIEQRLAVANEELKRKEKAQR